MTRTLAPAFAASLILWPSVSAAGPWTKGYESVPNWRSSKNYGGALEAEFTHGWAECIVDRWPELAQALLETMPESRAQGEAIAGLADAGQCIHSGEVAVYTFSYRGAIAERLLKSRRPARSFKPPFEPDETYESFTRKLMANGSGDESSFQIRRIRIARWVGYCAGQRNRPAVEALLRTKLRSKQEIVALEGLVPTFAGCLPPTRRLFASIPEIRTLLAEPLYWRRAAEAAPEPPRTKGSAQ